MEKTIQMTKQVERNKVKNLFSEVLELARDRIGEFDFDKVTCVKIATLYFKKCLDEAISGKSVRIKNIGEYRIYKKENKGLNKKNHLLINNNIDKYLHPYYYFTRINNNYFDRVGCKFYTNINSRAYIRDQAIKNNLDFPLYIKKNKDEYK